MGNITELSQAEVEQKLIGIVARLLVIDGKHFSASSRIRGDIPFDSLGEAEFMMEVEEAFNVTLSEDAHAKAFPGRPATIGSLAELILREKGK
jgi:acyl carrier protein